jgi:hypothetical protein
LAISLSYITPLRVTLWRVQRRTTPRRELKHTHTTRRGLGSHTYHLTHDGGGGVELYFLPFDWLLLLGLRRLERLGRNSLLFSSLRAGPELTEHVCHSNDLIDHTPHALQLFRELELLAFFLCAGQGLRFGDGQDRSHLCVEPFDPVPVMIIMLATSSPCCCMQTDSRGRVRCRLTLACRFAMRSEEAIHTTATRPAAPQGSVDMPHRAPARGWIAHLDCGERYEAAAEMMPYGQL